jgi:hypothetical protein
MKIAAAGNTEVPTYLVIVAKGYNASYVRRQGSFDVGWRGASGGALAWLPLSG